jgi:hypothetical protein
MIQNYNWELADWIKNYSINQHCEDYKLCVDLTYKYPIKNDFGARRHLKNLKSYFEKNGFNLDGIFVNEFDKNWNLHNHLLVWFDCNSTLGEGLIYNNWRNIGSCFIREYDAELGYSIYLTKHLNKSYNNNWDFISNLN